MVERKIGNLIAFRNGIYDISEDKFFQFSPEYVITNKIDNLQVYYEKIKFKKGS